MKRYTLNRNWVDIRWQYYSTHLHTNNTQNTQNVTYITIKQLGTYITIKKLKLIWEVRAVPRLMKFAA
jgi:hypothetical protein